MIGREAVFAEAMNVFPNSIWNEQPMRSSLFLVRGRIYRLTICVKGRDQNVGSGAEEKFIENEES